jgi:hypothetical protein
LALHVCAHLGRDVERSLEIDRDRRGEFFSFLKKNFKAKIERVFHVHQFDYIYYVCCSLARIPAFCQGASLTPR